LPLKRLALRLTTHREAYSPGTQYLIRSGGGGFNRHAHPFKGTSLLAGYEFLKQNLKCELTRKN
jgi:hypothetical protein